VFARIFVTVTFGSALAWRQK